MAGLMRVLGGALQGLGQGMTENGRAMRDRQIEAMRIAREDARRAEDRQWRLEDRQAGWDRDDAIRLDDRAYAEQQAEIEHRRGLIRASAGRTAPARFTSTGVDPTTGRQYGVLRDGTTQWLTTPDGEPLMGETAPVEFDRYETGADGVRYGIRNGEATPISGPDGQPFMVEAPESTAPAAGGLSVEDDRLLRRLEARHQMPVPGSYMGETMTDYNAVIADLERSGRDDLVAMLGGSSNEGGGVPAPQNAFDMGAIAGSAVQSGGAPAAASESAPMPATDTGDGADMVAATAEAVRMIQTGEDIETVRRLFEEEFGARSFDLFVSPQLRQGQ